MILRLPSLAIALAGVVLGACNERSGLGECLERAVIPREVVGGHPQLRLCSIRDSHPTAGPVEVVVVLGGSISPVSLVNNPEYYKFTVVNTSGDTVEAEPVISATVHYGERASLTLPALGALTFLVDLRCMRPMLAPPDTMFPACWSRYRLPAGEYRVSVRREISKIPGLGTVSGEDTLTIVSNEVSVRVQ
jgi:hypothetical protein